MRRFFIRRKAVEMLKRFIAIVLLGFSVSSLQAAEQKITIAGLSGTLLLPDKQTHSAFPVVLIVAGSGPTNRDGNIGHIHNNSLKFLAEGLATAGIASLRYDKRGIGESKSERVHESDMRFSGNVADMLSWYDVLQKDHRFSEVILAGHSEGALVVTLAAQQREKAPTKLKAIILLAGAGSPATQVLRGQLLKSGLSEDLRTEAFAALNQLENGKRVEQVSNELNAVFRQSVQDYLISWFALDPAKELERLSLPVLVVSAGQDLQVEPEEVEKLRGAAQYGQHLHIEAMNHILKPATGDKAGNVASYSQPDMPLAPDLMPALVNFIDTQK